MNKTKLPKHWPKPPKSLTDESVEVWRSVCQDMEDNGTLDLTDAKMIEVYVKDVKMLEWIESNLYAADTKLVMGGADRSFRHPLLDTYSKMSSKVQKDLNDLGLTPAARKSKPSPKKSDNPYKSMSTDGI